MRGSGGTEGTDDLLRWSLSEGLSFTALGALKASASEALLERTEPANLRWNQLIMGLLDFLDNFFI